MTDPTSCVPSAARAVLCAAALLAALPVSAQPAADSAAAAPAAADSAAAVAPLAWARLAGDARRALAAAEAERHPERRAAKAADAVRTAEALSAADSSAHARALLLGARQLHAAATAAPRGADAEPAASALAAALAAEAVRRAGPAHLFYPASAEALVEAQAAIARRHFSNLGRRGRTHLPPIERTLRRRGLPTDLRAVAIIESNLNPVAVSHAGAVGMWQFMPETAADYGLDSLGVRDPALQTEAAAVFLGRLHRMFRGDWHLALAAYNAGPGRVQRLARAHHARTGEYPTFWDLHDALPRETQAYVPRFIATVALIGPAPEPPPQRRRTARRRR